MPGATAILDAQVIQMYADDGSAVAAGPTAHKADTALFGGDHVRFTVGRCLIGGLGVPVIGSC
jgi:hypothetical protein